MPQSSRDFIMATECNKAPAFWSETGVVSR
jgi:hypothetical protein